MSSIFEKLTKKDFEKEGRPNTILGAIFKISKEQGSSARLEEFCLNLADVFIGKDLYRQIQECKYWWDEIKEDLYALCDMNMGGEQEELKSHCDKCKTQLHQENLNLINLVKIDLNLKFPLGALSEKIGDSEISSHYLRGQYLVEAISAYLLKIFNERHQEIENILFWTSEGDDNTFKHPPLSVLLHSERKDAKSILNFLKSESSIVEPLIPGEKSREELIRLFNKIPFFQTRKEGSEVYLDMEAFIIDILYRNIFNLLNRDESQARNVLANKLILIIASEFSESQNEINFHKQVAILLSFILKNFIWVENKIAKLNVDHVYIQEDNECEKIMNIANFLFLPNVLGHHANVKVSLKDVKETLKRFFISRKNEISILNIIQNKTEERGITTTMREEPKVDSFIYKAQLIVEDAIKKVPGFRDKFRELNW